MKLKDDLKVKYEILDALASKDKKELKKASYVAYNDIIEFPQPVAFTIKALKRIIKEVEKAKLKGKNMMVGMMLQIPIPKELQKEAKKGRKIYKTKSVKKKYSDLKWAKKNLKNTIRKKM